MCTVHIRIFTSLNIFSDSNSHQNPHSSDPRLISAKVAGVDFSCEFAPLICFICIELPALENGNDDNGDGGIGDNPARFSRVVF